MSDGQWRAVILILVLLALELVGDPNTLATFQASKKYLGIGQ